MCFLRKQKKWIFSGKLNGILKFTTKLKYSFRKRKKKQTKTKHYVCQHHVSLAKWVCGQNPASKPISSLQYTDHGSIIYDLEEFDKQP